VCRAGVQAMPVGSGQNAGVVWAGPQVNRQVYVGKCRQQVACRRAAQPAEASLGSHRKAGPGRQKVSPREWGKGRKYRCR
jgi:hypothetical protein